MSEIWIIEKRKGRHMSFPPDTPARVVGAKVMTAIGEIADDGQDIEVHTGSGWVQGYRTNPPEERTYIVKVLLPSGTAKDRARGEILDAIRNRTSGGVEILRVGLEEHEVFTAAPQPRASRAETADGSDA